MARIAKIDMILLNQLINEERLSQREASRRLGVSDAAVSKAVARLKKVSGQVALAESGRQFRECKFDALDALVKSSNHMVLIQDELIKYIQGKPNIFKTMEKSKELKSIESGGKDGKKSKVQRATERFDFATDPVKLAVMAGAEVKGHVLAWATISKDIYAFQEAQATIDALIEIYKEEVADVQKRIRGKVRQRLGFVPVSFSDTSGPEETV